jgi:DNA invertase Pin-like site-specific DNA recombinase
MTKTLTVELTDPQAEALAQFVKRVGWQEWQQNAVDDNEASLMRSAFEQLQKALHEAGFNPR